MNTLAGATGAAICVVRWVYSDFEGAGDFRAPEVSIVRRYAQVIQLRPEAEAEYVRYHAAVWPSVLKTISECGIRNYSIFLRSGMLFACFEYHGSDYEADMRKMAADPETQRWWSIMDPMQKVIDDALPGEKWADMREVFHFDGPVIEK